MSSFIVILVLKKASSDESHLFSWVFSCFPKSISLSPENYPSFPLGSQTFPIEPIFFQETDTLWFKE